MSVPARAVIVDLAANAIRLVVPGLSLTEGETATGVLDVGANGRLLGIELADGYVSVMDPLPGGEAFVRSATVPVGIRWADPPEISIPRRGHDYEITYPSGNQCWQVTTVEGELIQLCATIVGAREAPGGEDATAAGAAG